MAAKKSARAHCSRPLSLSLQRSTVISPAFHHTPERLLPAEPRLKLIVLAGRQAGSQQSKHPFTGFGPGSEKLCQERRAMKGLIESERAVSDSHPNPKTSHFPHVVSSSFFLL